MSDSDSDSSEEGQELDEVYSGEEGRGTQVVAAQPGDPGHGQVVASHHTAVQEHTPSSGGSPHHLPLQLPQPPPQDVKFEV